MSSNSIPLAEWNSRLLDHFFTARDVATVDEAVSCLSIAPADLARLAGGCSPDEATASFLELFRTRLNKNRRSLGSDASELAAGWTPREDAPPRFFAHLFFTCFVAALLDMDLVDIRNFRSRLTSVLGGGLHHGLDRLVPLWHQLDRWLKHERKRGRPARELILPEVGHLKIIGYSVRLAFPVYRDQARLVEAIASVGHEEANLAVKSVLRILGPLLDRFSARFQEEFADFRRRYISGDPDAYESPFWSAVRLASQIAENRTEKPRASVRFSLVMELDDSRTDTFVVTVLSESEAADNADRLSFDALESPAGEYGFAVAATDGGSVDPYHALVEVVLTGRLSASVAGFAGTPLERAVRHGVLLFERNEGALYALRLIRPEGPDVAALIREDLAQDFMSAVRSFSGSASLRRSLYPGWREVHGLSEEAIRRGNFGRFGTLRDVPCLQEIIRPRRLRVLGGIRVEGALLGRCLGLPSISSSARDVSWTWGGNETAPLALVPVAGAEAMWAFDRSTAPCPWEGAVTIDSHTDRRTLTNSVRFVGGVSSFDYAPPKDPGRWLRESPRGTLAFSEELEPLLASVDSVKSLPAKRSLFQAPGDSSPRNPSGFIPSARELHDLDDAVECLSARAAERRGLEESEFLEMLRAVFGLRGAELYDTARAWVEVGLFDRLTFRQWRGSVYFARRPRFVAYRERGDVVCVLDGLSPSYLRKRALIAVERMGGHAIARLPRSPSAPALSAFRLRHVSELHALSSELDLGTPFMLLSADKAIDPVSKVVSTSGDAPPNYELAGRLEPETGRLSVDGRSDQEFTIEWYRRRDRPDFFAIETRKVRRWWTHSRTWALLATYSIQGRVPFAIRGPVLHRTFRHSGHLPLYLGRLAAIVGGAPPGPQADEPGDYFYDFGAALPAFDVLAGLWPEQYASQDSKTEIPLLVRNLLQDLRRTGTPAWVIARVVSAASHGTGESLFGLTSAVDAAVRPRLLVAARLLSEKTKAHGVQR
jgi:hypothetical protein